MRSNLKHLKPLLETLLAIHSAVENRPEPYVGGGRFRARFNRMSHFAFRGSCGCIWVNPAGTANFPESIGAEEKPVISVLDSISTLKLSDWSVGR